MSVASLQMKAASPFRAPAAAIAVRSSVMCTAFSTVVAATSGLSVKPPVAENAAATVVAALSVTVQVPMPEQPPPLQPVKVEPAVVVAVKATGVLPEKPAEQVAPQETPAGLLVTVPAPAPVLETVNVKDCDVKVAVTVAAALIPTVHVRLPPQPPPLQPVKVEPAAGVAVKVTKEPAANEAEHVLPQEMPAGALLTVPVPVPDLLTVSVADCSWKVALTKLAALIVTMQPPLPEQPPLHPVKPEPASGVMVKVTTVPLANEAEHVAPQEMPAGELVMVPVPVPDLPTVSVKDCPAKVAVTEVAAFRVTVQMPVPEQPPPLQPEKVDPAVGAAVRVTAVPPANGAEHEAPQAMPAGLLVTVPAPALLTVSVKV